MRVERLGFSVWDLGEIYKGYNIGIMEKKMGTTM